jgi:hypothetical protein
VCGGDLLLLLLEQLDLLLNCQLFHHEGRQLGRTSPVSDMKLAAAGRAGLTLLIHLPVEMSGLSLYDSTRKGTGRESTENVDDGVATQEERAMLRRGPTARKTRTTTGEGEIGTGGWSGYPSQVKSNQINQSINQSSSE